MSSSSDDKTLLGFWIYLMTDIVLFATLFATFIILRDNTFGGPDGRELFSLPYVLAETMILLLSSFTAGLGLLAAYNKNKKSIIIGWFAVTFILGAAFLGMEFYEFRELAQEGHSWSSSAFLSAFFTLVGTHGAHITAGLIWMGIVIWRIFKFGVTGPLKRQLTMLSLFWHFLDIVWIFIFTVVFLMGEISV